MVAEIADIIKKNMLVFVDGLITTKMSVHVYDAWMCFLEGKPFQ